MSDVVFDASVVLAAVLREPGHEAILRQEGALLISAVNLAEARSRMVDKGYEREAIDQSISLFNLSVIPFDEEQATVTSELRRSTRAAGLSLGDRACIALAMTKGARVMTADRIWERASLPVEIELIR
jgi:PIN domain nuclease of toxin-antitoxin system